MLNLLPNRREVGEMLKCWTCGRLWSDGFLACLIESRQRCLYCIEAYSIAVLVHLVQVRNWCRWFDLCHVRGAMVGADKPQMDLSPSNSVIAIVPLHLMVPNVLPRRSDVWTLVPPDNIVVWLVGCQGDRLTPLPWGSSWFDVCKRNDFHFVSHASPIMAL